MDPPEETIARLKAIRNDREATVLAFDGTEMWYQEMWYQFPGIVSLETDDWGVKVTLASEHFERPVNLSARWDCLNLWANALSGQYCGWTLCTEPIIPELGINTRR